MMPDTRSSLIWPAHNSIGGVDQQPAQHLDWARPKADIRGELPDLGFRGFCHMADYDNRSLRSVATGSAVIDAGLRAYMLRVYNYMLVGLALTGATAWVTANVPSFGQLFYQINPATGRFGMTMLGFIALFAPLGSCMFLFSGSTG
jgi:hypothetical protein